jgi:Mg-chelatase subunit ChlD
MRYRRHATLIGSEDEVAGWVAMTDLFTLFAIVAITFGAANVALKDRNSSANDQVDETNKKLNLEIAELEFANNQSLEKIKNQQINEKNLDFQISNLTQINLNLKHQYEAISLIANDKGALLDEIQKLSGAKLKSEERANLLSNMLESAQQSHQNSEQLVKNEIKSLQSENRNLQLNIDNFTSTVTGLQKKNSALVEDLNTERQKHADALNQLEKLNLPVSDLNDKESRLRSELLGLEGSLDRVVFVLDRSSSMKGQRWEDAKQTIESWLKNLPVLEAALVVYGSDVRVFPSAGNLLPRKHAVTEFTSKLRDLEPEGETKTQGALECAYRFDKIDAIILFTDGQPSEGPEEVINFVKKKWSDGNHARIHVVGIGNYFDESFGNYLRALAKSSGGTFIGR